MDDRARLIERVITCEHASNLLPPGVDLGVAARVLGSHRAWDPGALEIARALGERLGVAPWVGAWSRLWVDLNRSEGAGDLSPARVDGDDIPGNVDLSPADRARRLADHRAWRAEAERRVATACGCGGCLHVSVHTFTPIFGGVRREVEAGVLFDPSRPREAALAERLLSALRAAGFDARPNAPYLGTDDGLTTWLRARHPDPVYVGIETELSQDLAVDEGARARFVSAVGGVLEG